MRVHVPIVTLASAALAACAVGPDYRRPEVALSSSYVNSGIVAGAPETPDTWWRGFNDPVLDRVVERALSQNLDLAQVRARVDQARAAAKHAGAALAPNVGLNASAARIHCLRRGREAALAEAQAAEIAAGAAHLTHRGGNR